MKKGGGGEITFNGDCIGKVRKIRKWFNRTPTENYREKGFSLAVGDL